MRGRLGSADGGRRAGAAAGAVLAGVLLTAGCGQEPPPVAPPHTAASGAAGSLTVQSIYVVPPPKGKSYAAGSSAYADVSVFNSAMTRDVLLSASSPRASSTSVQLDGQPNNMVNIAADGANTRGITVILKGLTSAVSSGQTVPITLTFQIAGRLTLDAPVRSQGN